MSELKLREAFNLAKHSYYHKSNNTYIIEKDGVYYCRVKTKKEAQRLTFHLKRIGFYKENLEKALKETNIERCRWQKRTNTGFYKTSKAKNDRYKLGYMYIYEYVTEDGKRHYIKATTLPKLRKKVLDKGLLWCAETDEAKELEKEMMD